MLFVRSIRGIRDIEKSGIDEDSFSEVRSTLLGNVLSVKSSYRISNVLRLVTAIKLSTINIFST